MNVLNYDKQLELKRRRLAHLEAFVDKICVIKKDARVSAGMLYISYVEFCKKAEYKPLSPQELYTRIDCYDGVIKVSGKSGQLFLGLTLVEQPERFSLSAAVLARALEARSKNDSSQRLQEKLQAALRVVSFESSEIAKLTPLVERANQGDPFWIASNNTLKNQIDTAWKILKEAEIEAQALRDLLEAKGEIPVG
jgi:hypothetical protein